MESGCGSSGSAFLPSRSETLGSVPIREKICVQILFVLVAWAPSNPPSPQGLPWLHTHPQCHQEFPGKLLVLLSV
jgi:hypothetical protein